MTETLYEKFRASINRDGADYGIVSRARGEARDRLEDDLINHLDYFDIPALTMMKSTKAVPSRGHRTWGPRR